MVKYYPPRLDETFGALADPIRRAVVDRLVDGPASVSDLAEAYPISLPGFLRHLKLLEAAGLVITVKVGRTRHCHLDPHGLDLANRWIEQHRRFWERQLDSLKAFLEQPEPEETPPCPPPTARQPGSKSGGRLPPPRRRSTRRGPTRPR